MRLTNQAVASRRHGVSRNCCALPCPWDPAGVANASGDDQYSPSFYGTFRNSWNLTVRTSLWQRSAPDVSDTTLHEETRCQSRTRPGSLLCRDGLSRDCGKSHANLLDYRPGGSWREGRADG